MAAVGSAYLDRFSATRTASRKAVSCCTIRRSHADDLVCGSGVCPADLLARDVVILMEKVSRGLTSSSTTYSKQLPIRKQTVRHLLLSLGVSSQVAAENSTLPDNMRNYHFTGPLRPVYPLSVKRLVPSHITRPDYADHRMSDFIQSFRM